MVESQLLTKNVFVAGGTPTVTYNSRVERQLESEVNSYLAQDGKALSISGPTKSGKTVLVERLLPRDSAVWIHGSDLTSAEALWRSIVDWLQLWDTIEISNGTNKQLGGGLGAEVGLGIAKLSGSASGNVTRTAGTKVSRSRALADVAREALRTLNVPIVIDDFHFVPDGVRLDLARAIKSIIPFARVIMIAVPYDAFEAVRAEPDLGGRVWQLQIDPWALDELEAIGTAGFEALGVLDRGNQIVARLARESFGAPFLMQQLCFDVCVNESILESRSQPVDLVGPENWDLFLRKIAKRTIPPTFSKIVAGARTRGTERLTRRFPDGETTDIYGAVVRGLQLCGPKSVTPYAELVRTLTSEIVNPSPSGQQVGSCLTQISIIADANKGVGDPVLVYKNDEITILDPLFLFYLSRGGWPQ